MLLFESDGLQYMIIKTKNQAKRFKSANWRGEMFFYERFFIKKGIKKKIKKEI